MAGTLQPIRRLPLLLPWWLMVADGGYFGPPNEVGTLEIGYSVSAQWRKQGIATELVGVLVNHAWH